MSSYTSEKELKARYASYKSSVNRAAVVDADHRTRDNPTRADHIPEWRHRAYSRKYRVIFARLAIKEQMVNKEKETKHREEEEDENERKVEKKKKKKMEKELDGDEKRWLLDNDDDWEEVHFSEDEGMVD